MREHLVPQVRLVLGLSLEVLDLEEAWGVTFDRVATMLTRGQILSLFIARFIYVLSSHVQGLGKISGR